MILRNWQIPKHLVTVNQLSAVVVKAFTLQMVDLGLVP